MLGFAKDERVAELLRKATEFKDRKDWSSAITVLAEAKSLMLISPVAYPAETWCKYPLYLQQAGHYEESMAEFRFLLDDLERRARRDSHLDDPHIDTRRGKLAYYKLIIRNDRRVIEKKLSLAQARELKKIEKNGR